MKFRIILNLRVATLIAAGIAQLFILLPEPAFAATVSWIGSSGDWNTATNWSTGTLPGLDDDVVIDRPGDITVTHSFANTLIKSLRCEETFVLASGTLTSTNNLQINTTFILSGGTLRQTIVVPGPSGSGVIIGSGYFGGVSSGTLDGVTLNAPMLLREQSQISIVNGLTLNSILTVGGTNNNSDYGLVFFTGTQTLRGAGQIVLVGDSVSVLRGNSGSTVTIGSGLTIHGRGGQFDSYGGTIINQGTILADISGGQIRIAYNSGNFTNEGVMMVTNGGRLGVQGTVSSSGTILAVGGTLDLGIGNRAWSNIGTINATNSTVSLGGVVTTAGLGVFKSVGSTVQIAGTLINTGSTLDLDSLGGAWVMAGGTIRGGTVTGTSTPALVGSGYFSGNSSGTLDDVTLNAPMQLSGQSLLNIVNGLTLNSVFTIGGTNHNQDYGLVLFDGTQTLRGAGQIVLVGDSVSVLRGNSGSTVTIGSGLTIHGRGGQFDSYGGTIINQGTILADISGGQIRIAYNSGNFTNEGVMMVTNGGRLGVQGTVSSSGTILAVGGTLDLGIGNRAWSNIGTINATNSVVNFEGTFTRAALGTLNLGGSSIRLVGTLDNTGATLNLDSLGGIWAMTGGTILGGTITGTNNPALVGGGYRNGASSGTLDGVTLIAPMTLNNLSSITVIDGLILNSALTLGGTNDGLDFGRLSFVGDQTISGNGRINLVRESDLYVGGGGTLTIGSNLTIHGHGSITGGTIINQGIIISDATVGQIDLYGNFTNAGQITVNTGAKLIFHNGIFRNLGNVVANGGTVELGIGLSQGAWVNAGTINITNSTVNLGGTFTPTSIGTLNRSGGSINVVGTLNNVGTTFDPDTLGIVNLVGGTLRGGTIIGTNQLIVISRDQFSSGGTLDGVTLDAPIFVGNHATLSVVNGLLLNSVMTIGGTNDDENFGRVIPVNDQTWNGTGQVIFNHGNPAFYGNGIHPVSGTTWTIGSGLTLHGRGGVLSPSGGAIINQGKILSDVANGQIYLFGTFTNQGTIATEANGARLLMSSGTGLSTGDIEAVVGTQIDFRGTAQVDGPSRLTTQPDATFKVFVNLLGNTRNPAAFSPQGTTVFNGTGVVLSPQFIEVMSQDLGAVPAGFANNFGYGTLVLANNTYVRLVDQSDNATGTGPDALYVNSLIVPSGCTLDLNGLHLYARAVQGTVIGGTISQISDSGPIALGTPTSGALSLPGELDEWTFFGRAGQTMTVLVELSELSFAEVRLLDPIGTLVKRGSNTVAQQTVALTDVLLSADGTYRIQVRAPANLPSITGTYRVTVWEVTPDVAPLVLNQTMNGRIETPYSVDRWTFSAVAGQQVRFDLINASAPGVAFTLRGPNGWIGFSNLVNNSGLVSLPASGAYALTAFGTGGAYDIDYAFQLIETVQTGLALGATFTGQFVGNGQAMLFRINLTGDRPFQITLGNAGTNNRVELYTGFGLPPTRGTFNYADNQGTGANREILSDTAYPGTHYVLMYGDSIGTPGEFTLTVNSADVFVTRLSPSKSGNGGTAIVEIQGVGLQASAQVRLEGNGVTLPATSVTRVSSTRLIAEFNLSAVASNAYQVVVTQGATSAGLPFEVTGGVGARFEADLIMPDRMGLTTVNTAYVEYQNVGDLPMVAPLLAVRGDGIGEPFFSLNPEQVSRDFWAASQPSFARKTISFFATGRIPGILMPGEYVRVPITLVGVAPSRQFIRDCPNRTGRIIGWRLAEPPPPCRPFGGPPIAQVINIHLLQFVPPSVLNPGSGISQRDQPLSWDSLRASVPNGIPADAWEAIWRNYTNAAGSTVYSFFGMQQQNVEYLYRLGLLGTSIKNTDDLLAFELAQADSLHMLRTLATATDGNAPTPGLRLSFDRSFPNSISGRYRMGVLGRGWSHNWEDRLTTNELGDVIIVGQGGSRRAFKPDVRGGYMGDLGDNGKFVSLPGGAFSLREKGGLVKEFHADGKLNFTADPNGNRITCGYTGDRLASLTHSSGQRLDLGYNAQGRIETITDSVSRITRFTYHPDGEHLATAEYYDGRILRYQYTSGQGAQREHALREIEFPDQSHQFFTYNSQGRLQTMSRDGGTELVTYAYDNSGTVFAIDAFGHTTKFLFDNRGLLVRMENPKGEVVQMRHDERFNLTGVTDPAGRSFDYTHDRQGNLTEIVNPLGHRTQFAYEPQFQRLSQLTDAKGNPTRYNYDDRGNRRGITDASGKSENWGYDAIGNPTTWTNRRRNDIDYQFNPTNGFLMAKLYPDGSRADYEYDPRGNLTAASNYTGRITLDYFPTNDRLQRITYPGNRWLDYTYDAAGRRRTMTDQLGYQLRYDYDTVGRLRSITNSDNLRLVHYQYDAAGRMALKTLGNGVHTTYTYDDVSRLENLTNALPNGSALSFFNYTYDERGRRKAMATHYGAWTYRYDDLGQLTNAVLASTAPQIPNQDLTYLYDAMGNRVRTVENGVVTDYTVVNNLNQYRQLGGTINTFDDDGNQIKETSALDESTFAYNPDNRLIKVTAGAGVWDYHYDALNNRAATLENGRSINLVIDPIGFGNVVGEYDGVGNLVARYDHGIGLLASTEIGGSPHNFTFDAIGNLQEMANDAGVVTKRYAYAPFGGMIREGEQIPIPFGFIGEFGVRTESNGFHHMRNRFYASSSGRFTNIDPLGLAGDGANLYSYALNSPIARSDPTGLDSNDGNGCGDDSFFGRFVPNSVMGFSALEACNAHDKCYETPFADKGSCDEEFRRRINSKAYGLGDAYFWGVDRFGDEAFKRAQEEANRPRPNIDWNNFWDLPDWKPRSTKILVPIYAADPNQKLVLTGLGERGYVQSGALLPYRIDFENDTNATAPAQSVFVTDRLATTLDWPTFELTEIGFGDERITLPPQTQHFETNLPVTINDASFVVQIRAGLRLDTGEVFCTFRSIDPNTDLPPPATAGFLPPENGTGRGQGHVAFVIRPKSALPSGTEIRNVALVDFDGRETIATDQVDPHNPGLGIDTNKQARVTIDAGAPFSTVTALPAESGHAFIVQWSGQDDAGGSGIESFDVFVSTNSGPFRSWLQGTTDNSAAFIGELGKSYAFYTIARDAVGNVETTPTTADAQTMVIVDAPLLTLVTDRVAGVGESIVISNMVQGLPATNFIWNLGARAPYGTSVNSSNGVLRWTPTCSQGTTTNTITVWATDRSRTNISDAITITVAVRECVAPQLGRLVLRTGDTGRLPIDLITSVPLTNLITLVTLPTNRFINLGVEALATQICFATITATNASLLPGGESQVDGERYLITLTTCTNQSLIGTQQVAWLVLTAVTNRPSAFVPVEIGPSIGRQPDGALTTNYVTQTGTVIVVGEEPLLEALRSTNGLVQTILYAPLGTTNMLQTSRDIPPQSPWLSWQQVTPTNLVQPIPPVLATNRTLFIRAVRQ